MIEETNKHVTYDEYQYGDLYYKNDTIFLRCNKYSSSDLIKKGDHIGIFLLGRSKYTLTSFLNLEVPDDLLMRSSGFMDYTNGGFFQYTSGVNYYFTHSPAYYENGKNETIDY